MYATTVSDSDSSNSDSKESYDGEGNYFAFMTIAHVESSDELNLLVRELGNIVMKNHWELLKNQMLKKMKAQPIFKKIITHSLKSWVSTHGWPRQL